MANTIDQTSEKIKILQAIYGSGNFVESIDHIEEDYLIYIYDNQYNLIKILHPLDCQ